MLSLNDGDGRVCIKCFERKNMDPAQLDKHDHAPFSPENFVPYHPFTKHYAQSKNYLEEGDAKAGKQVGGKKVGANKKPKAKKKVVANKKKVSKKNKKNKKKSADNGEKSAAAAPAVVSDDSVRRNCTKSAKRKLDLGAAPAATTSETKKSKEGDDDSDESELDCEDDDDGVRLSAAVFKTAEVTKLESDASYKLLLKQTVKKRKEADQDTHFKQLRQVIRSSAAAARKVYAIAAQAQAPTPSIEDFIKVLNYVVSPGNSTR